MPQVKPKKALGQHFLTDLSVAARIAATLDDYKGLPVLEVGPGMGVLTRPLLEAGHDVTVVEIDRESVDYLKTNFPELGDGSRIIEGDFLRLDLAAIFPGRKFCVIGNYPYNISSQIFFHVLEHLDDFDVRTAVPRTFERSERRRARRICIRARRGDDVRRKGRVVAAAVLGVENEHHVEDSRFEFGKAFVVAHECEHGFRRRKLGVGLVDNERVVFVIVLEYAV